MSESEAKAGFNDSDVFRMLWLGSQTGFSVVNERAATQAWKAFAPAATQNRELWEIAPKPAAKAGEPLRT